MELDRRRRDEDDEEEEEEHSHGRNSEEMKKLKNKHKRERKKRKARVESTANEADAKRSATTGLLPTQRERDNDTFEIAEDADFEDPYEDEFEEEEDVVESDGGDEDEDEVAAPSNNNNSNRVQTVMFNPLKSTTKKTNTVNRGEEEEEEEDEEDDDDEKAEMEYDFSAYGMLHRMRTEWPMLSFDFLLDHLGNERTSYPAELYVAGGTQASAASSNSIVLMHASSLCRTKRTEEDDLMELEATVVLDDDEAEAEEARREKYVDPILDHRNVPHHGAVNRIRAMPQKSSIVATWSETGVVNVTDCSKPLSTMQFAHATTTTSSPFSSVVTFNKHADEGYAMDWSRFTPGRLLTGDCKKMIYVWDAASGATASAASSFTGHSGSVEDLQWSPAEDNVFASCSTDGTVRIWDTRQRKAMLTERAHEVDVNVISWNRLVSYLLVSGSDDASFKVWDLRAGFGGGACKPVGWFKDLHKDAITSLEWSPHDESVLAVAAADDQVSVWDLALEEDPEFARAAHMAEHVVDETGRRLEFPPQLLFLHSGVKDPKEVKFHPQIVGLIGVTGEEGFDLFICEPLDPKSTFAAASSGGTSSSGR